MITRDERSLEFTITFSLKKLFKTGSAAIVSDCQKFFGFLPVSYQIDIRTAKFLEKIAKFMTSDNGICMLFERHAKIGINKILSTYGKSIQCQTWDVSLMNCSSVSHG